MHIYIYIRACVCVYVYIYVYADACCIGCKVPGKPANGMRSFQSTAIGSTVMYTCDDGFKLVGDKSRSCLDTGLWNGSVPACNCMKHM